MFFERELYREFIEWAQTQSDKPGYVLYLQGPRQVGKTELLLKLGREQFDTYVYVDMKRDKEKFEYLMAYHSEQFGGATHPEASGPIWEGVFRDFGQGYANNGRTLVILDEIQESRSAYNAIRYMRRGLKSKLAVSGSYLGIVTQSHDFFIAVGDLHLMELSSMTFVEFLKACGAWSEYSLIKTFDLAEMRETEKEACERVRELYKVYCEIGGYPDVVEAWVNGRGMKTCRRISSDILKLLYNESSRYFGEIVGSTLWRHTLERVAAHMVTKSGDLDIAVAKEYFRGEESNGLEIRRKDKINALKWLEDCRIVGMVRLYDELGRVTSTSNKSQFYFRDMGMITQLCKNSVTLLPSDITGMTAENFVYLQLKEAAGKQFLEDDVWSYSSNREQIDFIIHNNERTRFGIEVKHGSGGTKSGDRALADGRIDYLIRVQDTYGRIEGNQATVPIFMLDKLPMVTS